MPLPSRGSGSQLRPSALDGKGGFRRTVDAGNRGRDTTRNTKGDVHRNKTSRVITNQVAESVAQTAEQRDTLRLGLRVLPKVIAHAHLRRQAKPDIEVLGGVVNLMNTLTRCPFAHE